MKKVVKKKEIKIWTDEKVKWFRDEAEKWIKKYYLEDWNIKFEFEELNRIGEDETGWKTAANTNANSVYHKATITFYPIILVDANEKWSGEQTINNIKHELVHLITQKINDLSHDRYATEAQINDEIESLTQKISVIT